MKKFPKWSPPSLVDLYLKTSNKDLAAGLRKKELQILERLLTYPVMEWAWQEIEKQSAKLELKSPPTDIICYQVIDTAIEAQQQHMTRASKAKRYQSIAEEARKFATIIQDSLLNTTPYRWYPDRVIGQLLEKSRPELAEGAFCLIEPHPNPKIPRDTVWDGGHTMEQSDGHITILPIGYGGTTGLLNFFETLIAPQYPTMAKLAESLAKEADLLASSAMTENTTLPSPNIANAARLYFIRRMASEFYRQFGLKLTRTLASFASAALDEEVTEKNTQDALRGYIITER